jgi:hydrogenase maturation protease
MWTSDGGAEEPLRGSRGAPSGEQESESPLRPCTPAPLHTVVLGLGNPILGDDGVGWRVVEAAHEEWRRRIEDDGRDCFTEGAAPAYDIVIARATARSNPQRPGDCFVANDAPRNDISSVVEFDCVSVGGLALMERLVGCDRAIIVDAVQTRGGVPGTVYRLTLDDLPTLHADSAHDASLVAALALGRRLGAVLPQDIVIIGIEAVNVLDFTERLSPQVAASVGRAAGMVLTELEER